MTLPEPSAQLATTLEGDARPAASPGEPAPYDASAMRREVHVAIGNSIKLGLSLLGTWTLTLLVRFQLPRFLGPRAFGEYNFAESFAASFFVFLDLGVDTYIQKEVAVRPQHASDFVAGVVLLRGAIAAALIAVMWTVLRTTDRTVEVQQAACVFAVTCFVACINASFGCILQASSSVGRLALVNVLSKLVWGIGLVTCIATRRPMVYLPVPMLASELLRAMVLLPAGRAAVDLRVRIDPGAVKTVVVSSLPYFIASAAVMMTGKINITLLEYLSTDKREVGWLGAASNISSLAMIMYPLITWIVMPMLARARKRSTEDVFIILRLALEGLVVVTVPVSLMIALGADLWVHIAFGARYDRSALSVIAVAPQFVFTYTALILTIGLVILDRQWTSTKISLFTLIISPLLVLALVPIGAHLGEGGAAAGAGAAGVLSEIVVSGLCLWNVGRRAVAGRAISAVVKSLAIAAAVIVVDRSLRSIGWWRLAIDMALYAVAAIASGAVRVREAAALVGSLRKRRGAAA